MNTLVTVKDGFELLGVLALTTDWQNLEGNSLRSIAGRQDFGAQFTKFLRNGGRVSVMETREPTIFSETTILIVDYDQRLKDMISAGGYDSVHGARIAGDYYELEKSFSLRGTGRVAFEHRFFAFEQAVSSSNAIQRIQEADPVNLWSPDRIEHVFAFGAKHPMAQLQHPIVGLGSIQSTPRAWRGVPCLGRFNSERHMYLRDYDGYEDHWSSDYRFGAFRPACTPP